MYLEHKCDRVLVVAGPLILKVSGPLALGCCVGGVIVGDAILSIEPVLKCFSSMVSIHCVQNTSSFLCKYGSTTQFFKEHGFVVIRVSPHYMEGNQMG